MKCKLEKCRYFKRHVTDKYTDIYGECTLISERDWKSVYLKGSIYNNEKTVTTACHMEDEVTRLQIKIEHYKKELCELCEVGG